MIRTSLVTRTRQLLSAVALCAALGASPVALAQTNVVGSIAGTEVDPGSQVTVTNTGTGAARSATVDSTGRFQVSALPPGLYNVEVMAGERSVAKKDGVLVTIGGVTNVSFGTEELEEVLVSGQRADIDVTSTDTRTVFTAEDLQNLTVGLQLEEITLLAPGTVRGDSRYNTDRGRNSVSFGGSGANENAYYINGYAVTDPLKGLGSSSLPFNSIDQMQLLTGGYGAEFGRSTGGVVNIVTKRGTNRWVAGVSLSHAPDSLEGTRKDSYYENNGTSSDGLLWSEFSRRSIQSTLYSGYVGGPIVQDKLFIYLSGELEKRPDKGPRPIRNTSGTQATQGTDGWYDRDYELPRWLAKVDWNLADGHTVEFTGISDVQKQHREYYGYYYTSPNGESLPTNTIGTTLNGGYDFKDGGQTYIAKYTGALTENLIFTGLYGRAKNIHRELPIGYNPDVVPVRDNRNVASPVTVGPITLLRDTGAYDKSDGYRLDLEWLAGRHDVRLGYDVQNQEVRDGDVSAGPDQYIWFYDNSPTDPIPGSGGAANPGGNGDYVTRTISLKGGTFEAEQYAYFLEDRWQVTDKLLLQLGLRNENFKNYSADGTIFLNQTNQWAPRLGISYDLTGDARARVFANAGRYHLAIPLNLAFRQVGAATNTDEYFAFTSIDPVTGVPQGLTPLGDGPFSNNGEYGQARDPLLAAAQNLKPYYQDEFALGFESKLMDEFVGGARFIYRKLGSQIDDICDARPAYNWAVRSGYDTGVDAADIFFGIAGPNGLDDGAEHFAEQLWHCVIVNPGEANTIRFNAGTPEAPDYVFAELSAEDIGLPKVRRKYMGIDLFLEHPLRNGWYGRIDYTLSKSKGNAEGQLLSDLGQQDVAVTLNWDYAELMDGAYGPLPNDRKHQVKAFGFYQLTPEINLSATLSAWSGRPKSPSGYYTGEGLIEIEPTSVGTCDADCFFYNYSDYGGPYYRYVNGEPSPRGSGGRFPWTTSLDLGVSYSPQNVEGLQVALDVFNVLNRQSAQNRVDYAELGGPGAPYASTNRVLSYDPPRTVRFTVGYSFGQ